MHSLMNIFNESPHFTALLKLQFKLRPKRMHKNAPSTSLKALQMAVQKKEKDSSFRVISCKTHNLQKKNELAIIKAIKYHGYEVKRGVFDVYGKPKSEHHWRIIDTQTPDGFIDEIVIKIEKAKERLHPYSKSNRKKTI